MELIHVQAFTFQTMATSFTGGDQEQIRMKNFRFIKSFLSQIWVCLLLVRKILTQVRIRNQDFKTLLCFAAIPTNRLEHIVLTFHKTYNQVRVW